jgi:hypothetical protein
VGMRRNCAAEHRRSRGASGSWLVRENVAKRATEEAGRTDLFGDKANNDEPGRSTQIFLDGKSCIMRQR